MRNAAAVLPLYLSLLLVASPVRGQVPERLDRFDAARSDPQPTVRNGSPAGGAHEAGLRRSTVRGDSRTAFGVILGVVGGAVIGARMAPCDFMGPPPQMFLGALIGGGLMFVTARVTPR